VSTDVPLWNEGALIGGRTRRPSREEMLNRGRVPPHEDQTRRPRSVFAEMQAERVGPSGARVELCRMICEQRSEVVAPRDRICREILALCELGEAAVRTADARTLEVVNVGVGEQMKPRREMNDLDCAAAIVGDDRRIPRRHQQVEAVVVACALAFDVRERGGRR